LAAGEGDAGPDEIAPPLLTMRVLAVSITIGPLPNSENACTYQERLGSPNPTRNA